MVSQYITTTPIGQRSILRWFVRNLPAFEGFRAEFTAVWTIPRVCDRYYQKLSEDVRTLEDAGGEGRLTLLLMPEQMGLALKLLTTLIAGR